MPPAVGTPPRPLPAQRVNHRVSSLDSWSCLLMIGNLPLKGNCSEPSTAASAMRHLTEEHVYLNRHAMTSFGAKLPNSSWVDAGMLVLYGGRAEARKGRVSALRRFCRSYWFSEVRKRSTMASSVVGV